MLAHILKIEKFKTIIVKDALLREKMLRIKLDSNQKGFCFDSAVTQVGVMEVNNKRPNGYLLNNIWIWERSKIMDHIDYVVYTENLRVLEQN